MVCQGVYCCVDDDCVGVIIEKDQQFEQCCCCLSVLCCFDKLCNSCYDFGCVVVVNVDVGYVDQCYCEDEYVSFEFLYVGFLEVVDSQMWYLCCGVEFYGDDCVEYQCCKQYW